MCVFSKERLLFKRLTNLKMVKVKKSLKKSKKGNNMLETVKNGLND